MTKLNSIVLSVFFSLAANAAVFLPGGGTGSSVSGGLSNAYAFHGPFTVNQNTNVYLNGAISNLVANLAFTNSLMIYSNTIVVKPGPNAIANGILLTNAVKQAGTLASATRPMTVYLPAGIYGTPTNTLPSVMWAVDNVRTYWEAGAVWWSGTLGGDDSYMFDDISGARTNVDVMGYGRFYYTNAGNIFYAENATKVYLQGLSGYVTNSGATTASPLTWGGEACDITLDFGDYLESGEYDAIYGSVGQGQKLRGFVQELRAIGDLVELDGDSPAWGNVDLRFNIGKQTALAGQSTFLQMGGRTRIEGSQITVASTLSSLAASASSTTNSIISGFTIQFPAAGTVSPINAPTPAHNGMTLQNITVYGPTGVDIANISNSAANPLILENCTFYSGANSTNWIRGKTPSYVRVIGSLGLYPYKPVGSQITLQSTNTVTAIRNLGNYVGNGAIINSNSITAVASDIIAGNDMYANGAFFDSGLFTNILNAPNGAGPFSPGEGDLMFDNNYWATGRGAFVTWDGTANVVFPTILQSDTPSNGQVPTWNTGGTITWETPSGSGGGGPGSLDFNLNQFTTNTTVNLANGALLTNQSIRGITMPNVTASRAAAFNSSGNLTNSTATDTELGYLSGVTSAIQTQLSNDVRVAAGSGITVTPAGSGGIMTYTVAATGGGSGGTNFPAVINQLGSTNLDVTGGIRLARTITTNASFAFNLAGTAPNGFTFLLGISNTASSTIYLTNFIGSSASTAFSPAVASNITTVAIPATSIKWLEYIAETNFNLGTVRWNIIREEGKTLELAGAGNITLHTNSAGSLLTISNTPPTAAAAGNSAAIQFNEAGVLDGTNQFTFDRTNNRVAIALGGTRPNTALEIGGTGAFGTQIRLGGSSTSKTNLIDSDGMGQLTDAAIKFYIAGGVAWYIDSSPRYGLHPGNTNGADVGTFLQPVATNWTTWVEVKDRANLGNLSMVGSADIRTNLNAATLTATNAATFISTITSPKANLGSADIRTNLNAATFTTTNAATFISTITTPKANLGSADVRTNLAVNQLINTNMPQHVANTVAGVGGANTNFTFQATTGPVTYVDAGTTNVNIVAIMGGTAGLPVFKSIVFSNLTTTSRQLSRSAVTNAWFNLSHYAGFPFPITITNKHRLVMAAMIDGTNVTTGFQIVTNGF